ncbi:MAG: GTP-binding protein [Oscillospiraceae bacterium]|nr:GTP-binding protein [Oscillospiraceae bacterium]MDY3257728.1 CobW family GTP-binding protein [Ruminococcus callidus]
MSKVDIFSGFLGAGKTTLIKKLISEAYCGEKLVLIENEFGQIGIDGGFLQDAGINITEMNSGCICCSLVGDFGKALKKVIDEYSPERILIEPSGVGKLSDVIKAVQNVDSDELKLNGFTTIVDAKKCKMYMKNFGEFFNNQIEFASSIILSHTKGLSEEKINECVELLKGINPKASIITTDWDEITGKQILETMEKKNTLEAELEHLKDEAEEHEHHHHHDHDEEFECGCHDHDHEHEHHHHHDHDEECECGCHDHDHEHEHHHDHDEECECGCHDHDHEHHHHHHADDVFTSWGVETPKKYTKEKIENILNELQDSEKYGVILRAKGIVPCECGKWIHFDYVPGTPDVRTGSASTTGMLCVIGSKINEDKIAELFEVK